MGCVYGVSVAGFALSFVLLLFFSFVLSSSACSEKDFLYIILSSVFLFR
jgi:hypothetical protein